MDDYSLTSLTESKNEWCARLVSLLTHHIVVGIDSIFNEALTICINEDEENKYLMTFQNLLSTIPNWNVNTIDQEKKRIEHESGCKYLEDLITCVHIIQLKALTCIRVGQKQKKIDINIPSVDKFIHNIYINVARKLYTNIYLFEKDLYPLQVQKNKHEVEYLVKEAILLTIRDNIPVERILQCYMEENEEVEIPNEPLVNKPIEQKESTELALDKQNSKAVENIPVEVSQSPNLTDSKLEKLVEELKSDKEHTITPKLVEPDVKNISESLENIKIENNLTENKVSNSNLNENKLSIDFSDKDMVIEPNGVETEVTAPKDLATLEKISEVNNAKRKEEEEDDDKLNIGEDVSLELDVLTL
jgi:hypothetical protein